MAPTLVAALAARAESEQPWLFWRDDGDWCWRSWRQVADQVARAIARLRTAPRGEIAYDPFLSPDAIAADLALQGAGMTAVPARQGDRCERWAIFDDDDDTADRPESADDDPASDDTTLRFPVARRRLDRWQPVPLPSDVSETGTDGGVRLGDHFVDPPTQLTRARDLGARLEPLLVKKRAPIAVVTSALDEPWVRDVVIWSLLTGPALVLEPAVSELPFTTHWARPMLVAGPVSALRSTAATISGQSDRYRRLRVAIGPTPPDEAEREAWEAIEVERLTIDLRP